MKILKSFFSLLMLSMAVSVSAQPYELSQFDGSLNPDPATVWVVNLGDGGAMDTHAYSGLRDAIMNASAPVSVKLLGARPLSHGAFQDVTNIASVDASQATSLADGCFFKSSLTSIVLNNNITNIGRDAFRDCRMLASISFSEEPRTANRFVVGSSAFQDCRKLVKISMPYATTVDSYAFAGCLELVELELPRVKVLGKGILGSCNKLTKVDLSAPGSFYFTEEGNEMGEKLTNNLHYPAFAKNCTLVLNEDKGGKKGKPKADMENRAWLVKANGDQAGEPMIWKEIVLVKSVEVEPAKKSKKRK